MSIKTLYLDIETTPIEVYVWRLHKPIISPSQIKTPSRILCFSAKWRGERGMIFEASWKGDNKSYMQMLRRMHALLSQADRVGTYNGDGFDLQKINGQLLRNRFTPPAPYDSADFFKVTKKLGLDSGKLEWVGPYLNIGKKKEHEGFKLWLRCMDGEVAAQKRMERYCKQDTRMMEPLDTLVSPWAPITTNAALYFEGDEKRCPVPTCGSTNLISQGIRRCRTQMYRRYVCLDCGAWPRERLSCKDKNKEVLVA